MNKQEQEIIKKYFRKIASKGGKATVAKYGTTYMSDLVKKRWDKKDEKNIDK